jgi:hypothetical protein
MMSLFRRALLLAVTLPLVSCAGRASPETAGPARDGIALVRVTNNNWSDMIIYVLKGGTRTRLGRVPSLSTVELKLPRTIVGIGSEFEIAADPVGPEQAFRTGSIHVEPGQWVEFTIQNHLEVSYYSIWDI